jgi:C-terminal processing protease CtpA/Prc
MDSIKKILFLAILLGFTMSGCVDVPEPDDDDDSGKAPKTTIAVNAFVEAVMQDVYLWYATLPDIDIRYEFDTKAYFEKLLNKEDKWSFITEDAKKLEDSFEGKETSFGWSLAFGRYVDQQNQPTGTLFSLVEFVYPNTPADKAGIKRGDMIYKMDGLDITMENYMDLLNTGKLKINYRQTDTLGVVKEKTANMIALELNLDPVQFAKIIEHGGHKIGYMFYAQFVDNYNASIDAALQYFLTNQVTDVVLDLRYNPGGYGFVAKYLCSGLAPINVVNEEKILVKLVYNDKYQKVLEQENDKDNLRMNFNKSVPVKMGLTKLYIITGPGTASASELAITGLKPYMNVKTIGETTYGKYTGSRTLKPEYYYESANEYKDFKNWAVQPIVLKYANSLGVTDFKEGFAPDVFVEDDLFSPIPLGDKKEAMLKKALEEITGIAVVAKKSATARRDYKIIDRGFSKFDANKRELLMERIE